MNTIRPVSDLRNNFADISRTVHETAQPVFLTRNGYGDMVVMSMEAYENLQLKVRCISSFRRPSGKLSLQINGILPRMCCEL